MTDRTLFAMAVSEVISTALALAASDDRPGQDGNPCVFCGYLNGAHSPTKCAWYSFVGACDVLDGIISDDD